MSVRLLLYHLRRYVTSRNLMLRDLRKLLHRPQVRCLLNSPISGRIEVIDRGRERQLLLDGRCHSFGMTRGSEAELNREYWGHLHRTPYALPARPRVLMCGLGGGTGLKLLARELLPSALTVVELDPLIVQAATSHFGLGALTDLHVHVGDARYVAGNLATQPLRYDLIVEDAMLLPILPDRDEAQAQLQRLVRLLAPGGSIVLNAPIDGFPHRQRVSDFCAWLRAAGMRVFDREVGQRWHNRVVYLQPGGVDG